MKAPDRVYLRHVLDATHRIASYVEALDLIAFLDDEVHQDAVIRQLEIIWEAVKRLSSEARAVDDRVPWRDIAGMRDKLIHDYMGVDLESVWKTTQIDVPELAASVAKLLELDGG